MDVRIGRSRLIKAVTRPEGPIALLFFYPVETQGIVNI